MFKNIWFYHSITNVSENLWTQLYTNGRETDCLSTQPSICLARAQLIISNQARLRRPSARDSIMSRYRVQYWNIEHQERIGIACVSTTSTIAIAFITDRIGNTVISYRAVFHMHCIHASIMWHSFKLQSYVVLCVK